MKTQEEIQGRIDLLWAKIENMEVAINEENKRLFPNKRAIKFIRKLIDDMKSEVVHLSWILI